MDPLTSVMLRATWLALLAVALVASGLGRAAAVIAEVRPLNGAPALFIDGRPANGLLFSCGPSPSPRVVGGALVLANSRGYYSRRSVRTTANFGGDFTLEATLTVRELTGSSGNVSLWVNETAAGSYFLSLSEVEGERVLTLWKAGPGGWEFGKWLTHPLAWTEGTPVRVQLDLRGGHLAVSADGALIAERDDPEPLPPGPLKVSVYHVVGAIDDLRITRPDGSVVLADDFSAARSDVWQGVASGDVPSFEEVGLSIAMVDLNLEHIWPGPGSYDFDAIDRQVANFVALNPGCRLFMRLRLNPPAWWTAAHPDDIATYQRPGEAQGGRLSYASFSSPRWRQDTGEALRAALRRIMAGEHAERFVGFNLLYAFGPEWEHPCSDMFLDFSPVNIAQYREWLRAQYPTDEALAAAWHQPDATLADASPPPAQERLRGDFYELRDPARGGQRVADYLRFTDESVVDAIAHMAGIVKAETQRRCVVVAHYGYHFEGYDGFDRINYHERGHHAIDRFLALGDIDGSGSAYQYRVRQAGGSTVPITTVASLRLHGKLYWLEDDTRTHLSSPTSSYGRAANLWESVNILKRNAAAAIAEASPMWYLDFEGNWHADPQIMRTIGQIRRIADQALARDRRRNAEIAVIVNQRTVRYLRSSTALWLPVLCHEYFEELPRIGAPFDSYVIEDLAREDMPDYKLYLRLDTFALNERERELVRDQVLGRGHTVLWHYAPGYITEDALSDQAMSEIAGMRLSALDAGGWPRAMLADLQQPMTRGLPPGLAWGPKLPIGPLITCTDPEAQVLAMQHAVPGTTPDGRFKLGDVFEPGMAVKDMGEWTSVWCGVPPVPAPLLRGIARAAGVHIYDDAEDFVCANSAMVALHTRYAGERTIRLPRRCRVVDAFTGEQVGADIDSFTVPLRRYETRMWWLEDPAR
ncbi:MAG: beta-galactosidase [Armatimonadota bacterium]